MRAQVSSDYESFALDVVDLVPDRPISFEVFSDDDDEHVRAGAEDRVLGRARPREDPDHQHVGREHGARCSVDSPTEGVQLNVTALLTLEQVESRRRRAARRRALATSRCSQGASPTPAAIRYRS